MTDNEISGTKDPTFHRILLDTRFELPLGGCHPWVLHPPRGWGVGGQRGLLTRWGCNPAAPRLLFGGI